VTERWTADQLEAFERDGFLLVEELVDAETVDALRGRFEPLFAGRYESGIRPDEVNWIPGRDPEDRTRQICNAWKADPMLAAQVLSERTGRLAAELVGWDGVRLLQDNCLWKPPGAKAIGMHQDGSYLDYVVPPEMITCWIALDDTAAGAGTLTYARGSRRRSHDPPLRHLPWVGAEPGGRSPAGARLAPDPRGCAVPSGACRPGLLALSPRR
jgi:ectoine hydroxylase-related dioxygenase (phytanoyl-CoA dioxygenase family)